MLKLSIYITTQNRPLLLARALDSLAKQTVNDFEVIICDDCSEKINQQTNLAMLAKYQHTFAKISYLLNDKIEGACYSRNRAISSATGVYITGLDDDDVFHPERVKIFFDFLQANTNFSFLCSRTSKLTEVNIKKSKIIDASIAETITLQDMKQFNAVGNQIFIEKQKLNAIGGFDTSMPAWQDYDTWFRLIKEFGPAAKLKCSTMFLDDDDNRVRITTSSKSYQGYQKFLLKHGNLLSEEEKLSLFYMDKLNRKQSINFFSIVLIKNKNLFFRVFKYYLTYKLPYLFRLYERLTK
jgi:glycosyltransferase involved in cell wall biosynthesis